VLDRTTHRNGGVAWFVFDHQAVDRSTAGNTKAYKQLIPEREGRQSPNWNPTMIDEQVEAGRIHTADTIAELAEKAGLPVDQLQATIETYNSGNDHMGKDAQFVRPITEAPFYAAEVRLATLCWTAVGPAITERGEVIDTLGRPISGAYACGEVTGGVLGDVYVGSGNSIGNSATFGRIAGRSAAQDVSHRSAL
jgi:succinate dehydrogenase/fumarate reductase flavoprotein subunit